MLSELRLLSSESFCLCSRKHQPAAPRAFLTVLWGWILLFLQVQLQNLEYCYFFFSFFFFFAMQLCSEEAEQTLADRQGDRPYRCKRRTPKGETSAPWSTNRLRAECDCGSLTADLAESKTAHQLETILIREAQEWCIFKSFCRG